ncbi:MAG: exo-beta-1,3-glucanase [Bacteroidota bacterium]
MRSLLFLLALILLLPACMRNEQKNLPASEILGNPSYPAVCYGGYRQSTRDSVPTVEQIREDLKILEAAGIRFVRTYNTQQYPHAARLLQAIRELKKEDPAFTMYVMLGTWIECAGAWTGTPDHTRGNEINNSAEISAAVELARRYPDIVKVIAVGNEAMIHWASGYYVDPEVILRWVKHLQDLKKQGRLSDKIWITSSDNYEAWGGGEAYRTPALAELVEAVDYISLHTYPYHETYYHPSFWNVPESEEGLSDQQKTDQAMLRAKDFAVGQYNSVVNYVSGLGLEKEFHIGETGWSTMAVNAFGPGGSRAADEYKQSRYYELIREWTSSKGITCFFFEAFDEKWKDGSNLAGSENHFGLFTGEGQAKLVVWNLVDDGKLAGLSRDGFPVTKTFGGDSTELMSSVLHPPLVREAGIRELTSLNTNRAIGEEVTEDLYVLLGDGRVKAGKSSFTLPSAAIDLVAWDGSCGFKVAKDNVIEVTTGPGPWWGGAADFRSGKGENLSLFTGGKMIFEIKGDTRSRFELGFRTTSVALGGQSESFVTFGPGEKYSVQNDWKSYEIPLSEPGKANGLQNLISPLFFRGVDNFDGKTFFIRNIRFVKDQAAVSTK